MTKEDIAKFYFTTTEIDSHFWLHQGIDDVSKVANEEVRVFAREKVAFRQGFMAALNLMMEKLNADVQ